MRSRPAVTVSGGLCFHLSSRGINKRIFMDVQGERISVNETPQRPKKKKVDEYLVSICGGMFVKLESVARPKHCWDFE